MLIPLFEFYCDAAMYRHGCFFFSFPMAMCSNYKYQNNDNNQLGLHAWLKVKTIQNHPGLPCLFAMWQCTATVFFLFFSDSNVQLQVFKDGNNQPGL